MICQQCQGQLLEGTRFCPQCGTPVPEPQAEAAEKVDKFDFDASGEALAYISLQQAALFARRQARQNDETYKERFSWGEVVWTELRSEAVGEDYYRIVLQFRRPARGILEEQTGEEEFLFDTTGILQDRQVLVWPDGLQMREPDRPPQTSGEEQEIAHAVTEDVGEYEQHSQQPEEDPEAYIQLGEVAYGNQEYQEALEHFTQAIQLDPDHIIAYRWRGSAYYNLGEYQRAIEDYDKAIHLDPDAATYNNRGMAYSDLGEPQRAMEDYDKSIQLDPNIAYAYYNRGLRYYNLGEHQRAIEDYDKAIQLDPNDTDFYDWRGKAYYNLGEHQRAIEDLDKAIQLDPNIANAYHWRGAAYSGLGEHQRAIEDYDKAIQLDPNNAFLYNNRGDSYTASNSSTPGMLGQPQRAIEDYDKAIQLDPNNAVFYNNRGRAYKQLAQNSSWMKKGKWSSKAQEDFDKARSLESG